jgi:hypothetical protein
MITLGTGIGTAAMIGGALLYGKHFQASNQGGHSPILFNGRNCIMSDNSINVQTAKETVTVYTMVDTKFVKSGVPASITDLNVGDRVVIHAGKMDDKLMAHEVRFGPTEKRE